MPERIPSDLPVEVPHRIGLLQRARDVAAADAVLAYADLVADTQTSARMAAVRRRDTAPELALRRALHARGLRYRVDHRVAVDSERAPRPDVVFVHARVAVFVHGCFWHGCPLGHKGTAKSNPEFWDSKIAGNRRRDVDQVERLTAAGWTVLVFWEHEDPQESSATVEAVVRRRTLAR